MLGHRIRPGDLPSDAEVREQLIALGRDPSRTPGHGRSTCPSPSRMRLIGSLAEHLDRFAIYKMRLEPLESVKQNPKHHPEGDALYHSLQVFHLARRSAPTTRNSCWPPSCTTSARPSIRRDHVAAGVDALRGSVTERTLWLIEHHMDLSPRRERSPFRAN